MAFHVTQCPGCESTFNTNARILQAAAGKVRCGACLTVFTAADNFVSTDDAEELDGTSVFVGNNPGDYFDPSQFITRSALTSPDATSDPDHDTDLTGATSTDPVDEFAVAETVPVEAVVPPATVAFEPPTAPVADEVMDTTEADSITAGPGEVFRAEDELDADGGEVTGEVEAGAGEQPEETSAAVSADQDDAESDPWSMDDMPSLWPGATAALAADATSEQDREEAPGSVQAEPVQSAQPEPVRRAPEDIRIHASFSLSFHPNPTPPPPIATNHVPEAFAVTDVVPATEPADELPPHIPAPVDAKPIAAAETEPGDDAAESPLHAEADHELDTAAATTDSSNVDATSHVDTRSADDELHAADTAAHPDAESAEEHDTQAAAQAEIATPAFDATDGFDLIDVDTFEYVAPANPVFTPGDTPTPAGTDDSAPISADRISATDTPDHGDVTEADAATAATVARESADDSAEAELPVDESTEAIRARAFRAELRDDDALEALPLTTRSAIGRDLPPVELLSGKEARWAQRIALTAACLLLSAALVAQFLWQRLPVYSRTAQFRPLYEFACQYVPCDLPVYTQISAIRSDNLVVRSHPTVSDALTVSLNFRNTAQFPQPFPVLILSFNSATNAIIALREFAPNEYLSAGLQSVSLMPAMSPVQVDIDVMDPGPDAVNYTVAFRRP